MSGITGIISTRNIITELYAGIQRLEYQGYDSAGMAVLTNNSLDVRKDAGKIVDVNRRQHLVQMSGRVGIAHTRWATHGGVTQQNAQPHVSMDNQFAIVHNGIIENYRSLRQELRDHGFHFRSETDSEVIVHLITYYFQRGMSVEEAMVTATHRLEGAFAFALVTAKAPDTLFCARMESPLVIGVGDQSLFLASDVNAFAAYTRQAVYLNDGEYALLQAHNYQVKSLQTTKVVTRDAVTIEWNGDQGASKGHYPHYMIKEIQEGAACIDAAMDIPEADINELAQRIATHQRSFLTGVGTAYYVAQMAQYYFSSVANCFIPAISADELPSLAQPGPQDLTLAISQSGETYDTLKALRYTKLRGGGTAAVVNVPGSSMVREVDQAILQGAGPEICVLSTKSTISQMAIMIRVALALAHQRALYSDDTYAMCTHMLRELPLTLQHVYAELVTAVRQLAQTYCHIEHWFFIGRGIYSAVAMEAALKFKEVSYLHAEGMSGGFLKHGTIALIDDRTHSLAFIPHPDEHALFNATLTDIQQIRARGGLVIGIHQQKDESLNSILDHEIILPQTSSLITPLVYLTTAQMLAYHIGLALGRNIDKPRALAKVIAVGESGSSWLPPVQSRFLIRSRIIRGLNTEISQLPSKLLPPETTILPHDEEVAGTRRVTAWLEEAELPLEIGERYRLGINIEEVSINIVEDEELLKLSWDNREELGLLILLGGKGAKIEPISQQVTLPRRGDMPAIYFHVSIFEAGTITLYLSIFLAQEYTLLEEFLLPLQVSEAVIRELE